MKQRISYLSGATLKSGKSWPSWLTKIEQGLENWETFSINLSHLLTSISLVMTYPEGISRLPSPSWACIISNTCFVFDPGKKKLWYDFKFILRIQLDIFKKQFLTLVMTTSRIGMIWRQFWKGCFWRQRYQMKDFFFFKLKWNSCLLESVAPERVRYILM